VTPGGIEFDPRTERETILISHAVEGDWPNGASRHPSFSQDRQLATVAAFDSEASNIVEGDTNGVTDVFAVLRSPPYDLDGPKWRPHSTIRVSVGPGGQQADGPSYLPSVSGSQHVRPRCVAFISDASNLVAGDTNGRADAFLYWIDRRVTQRVSVGSRGEQSDGDTVQVKVDGGCRRVAFVSDASNLALTRTSNPRWRPAVTASPPPGTRQAYVRVLGRKGNNAGLHGLTFLASASNGRRPASTGAGDITLARESFLCRKGRRCGDWGAEALFFSSDATNLSKGKSQAGHDVYKRELGTVGARRRKGKGARARAAKAPTVPRPPFALALRTRLVTAGANGPSTQPASDARGRYVAFTTLADNLVHTDDNAFSDVVRADLQPKRTRFVWVSRSAAIGSPGNGNSAQPSTGRPGSPVFFTSEAANLQPNKPSLHGFHDRNAVADVFFWNIVSRNVSLESRDSENHIPNLPEDWGRRHRTAQRPPVLSAPSHSPAGSAYGNYVLFESGYPLLDLNVAGALLPELTYEPRQAALIGRRDPAFNQVYLRYIGPR